MSSVESSRGDPPRDRGPVEPPRGSARERLRGASRPSAATDAAGAIEPQETERPETVGLETVVDGLDAPIAVAFAPNADRRYVAERDGRVYAYESDDRLSEPFLDLRDVVLTDGERGLLGLTLHPDFDENRRAFVHYSTSRRPGTPADFDHTGVLAEFRVDDDAGRAIRNTQRTILEVPQPEAYHNGGDIAFGPGGHLYVALGEGGAGGRVGQEVTENLLGSVLRIDVDEGGPGTAYAVPEANPLVGRDGLDEYYAWGFRNPWRLSFDGDDLFVADVGERDYEEVNLVEKGGNYGWNFKEGTRCRDEDDCPDEREDAPLLDPIIEYPHAAEADAAVTGVSVIGGYVYRGSALPALEGAYVFGDFLAEGRLFAAFRPDVGDGDGDEGDDELWPIAVLEIDEGEKLGRLLSFGRDGDGEVYALGTGADGGGLFRVVPAAV